MHVCTYLNKVNESKEDEGSTVLYTLNVNNRSGSMDRTLAGSRAKGTDCVFINVADLGSGVVGACVKVWECVCVGGRAEAGQRQGRERKLGDFSHPLGFAAYTTLTTTLRMCEEGEFCFVVFATGQ